MKVAVLGHRDLGQKDLVKEEARKQIIKLIGEGADTFCFAYYGGFITQCYKLVGELKEEYDIKRVLVRPQYSSERKVVDNYILSVMEQGFDDCIRYKDVTSQRSIYNMIDECDVLLTFYFECHVTGCEWGIPEDYEVPPVEKRSATARAVFYAKRKKKRIINVFELLEVQ
ncbi:MAG: hypothetical protein K2H78_02475 [Clostridia bacterium]|nr:hypothetical protein [Clostridia bacterium]